MSDHGNIHAVLGAGGTTTFTTVDGKPLETATPVVVQVFKLSNTPDCLAKVNNPPYPGDGSVIAACSPQTQVSEIVGVFPAGATTYSLTPQSTPQADCLPMQVDASIRLASGKQTQLKGKLYAAPTNCTTPTPSHSKPPTPSCAANNTAVCTPTHTATVPPSSPPELAHTGADVTFPLLGGSLLLVAFGAAAVALARRPRKARH